MGCCLLHGHHLNLNEQIWLSGYCQELCHDADTGMGLSRNRRLKKEHGHDPKNLKQGIPLKAALRAWENTEDKDHCQQQAKIITEVF